MVHFHDSLRLVQCPALPFVVIGTLVAPMIVLSPLAAQANEFATCAASLIEAGVEAEAASAACAQALKPEQVSRCVVDITNATELAPDQVLAACSRDRRPDELATCVATIHDRLEVSSSTDVLDNCRRSVLPVRYSDCVVGLATTAEVATTESMAFCIAAGYRPVDVAPTFIFAK